MEFHRDHPHTDPDERGRQGAGTRPEIDDQIGLADAGAIDDVASGAVIEPVKPPSDVRSRRPP